MKLEFPLLSANDIECRVGTAKEGSGVSLLLYKDARVDMRLLDEVVGWNNWQREHKELKGNLYCGVSVYDSEKLQWITKWDCGKESNTEAEKGEASDSFKRACFNFGIGRELYTAPFIWVAGATKYDKFFVKEIDYNSKREISKLVICNEKTKEVAYTFGTGKQTQSVGKTSQPDSKDKIVDIEDSVALPSDNRQTMLDLLTKFGDDKERWTSWVLIKTGVKTIGEVPEEKLPYIIDILQSYLKRR